VLLIVLCAAALCGLAAGTFARLDAGGLGLAAVAAGLAAACAWHRPLVRTAALACAAMALGAFRVAIAVPADPDPLAGLEHTRVVLHGEVISTPLITPRSSRFTLQVSAAGSAPVDARVQIIGDPAGAAGKVAIGDTLVADGRLLPAEGGPLRTLLFPQLEVTQSDAVEPMAIAASIRAAAVSGIQAYLPEPQASLAAGVLLGGSGNLSPEFRQQLQRSGLAHIVAIDGFKQVIVTAVLGGIAVRLVGRRKAAVPLLLGVLAYTVLTGARPSAVRAGLMVGMTTVAATFGRVSDSLTSLLIAAVIMTLHQPTVLLDVGFQLSFSATLGLIVLWPRLLRRLRGAPHWLADPAGVTGVVTVTTLPVMLSVFHEISLVSPLSHVVAMPLLTPVLLGAAVLSAVSAWPPLAHLVASVVWVPATLLSETVRISGSVPGAALSTGHLPPGAALALAAALLAACIWALPEMAHARATLGGWYRGQRRLLAPALVAAVCALGCGMLVLVRADGQLSVEPLSVGRGQALLIRGPTGKTALVVSGRIDGRVVARQIAERLPVWEHGMHAVLALDEESHTGVEAALERYPAAAHVSPDVDGRVDLGGGAVLDIYADATADPRGPRAGVSVSFGRVWLQLAGRPPLPPTSPSDPDAAPLVIESISREALRSDGVAVWRQARHAAAAEP